MDQKKYYTVEEAAQILGISPAEVNQKRERNELRGFRDGATWKFKTEDVEALVRELRGSKRAPSAEDSSADVLVSETTVGESSVPGTVIGPTSRSPADSDIQLADKEINLVGDEIKLSDDDTGTVYRVHSKGSGELEIALDDDALIDDQQLVIEDDDSKTVASPGKPGPAKPASSKPAPAKPASVKPADDSSISLAGDVKKLDDDDIVLGGSSGSGSGSDITIGGDSGISLLDPTDSGLSLEEPLDLDRTDDDSLELGEDDMLTFAEDTVPGSTPSGLKKDEEFLLTPLEEAAEEESESGSQVIALDTPVGEHTATMIATPAIPGSGVGISGLGLGSAPKLGAAGLAAPAPGMAAMLDEDFAGSAGLAASAPGAAPLGAGHPVFLEGGPLPGADAMALPESPYSGLNITSLALCVFLLIFCGMFAFDLLRNMWSWNGAYPLNSWLMDTITGLFG